MRLTLYILHLNILTGIIYVFFLYGYQIDSATSKYEDLIDSRDINMIIKVSSVTSLLMLPYLTEPLAAFFGDVLVTSSEGITTVQRRRSNARNVLYAFTLMSVLGSVIVAPIISSE